MLSPTPVQALDFHIVLVEPEIPQNTGSVGRLTLALGSTLHLIEPLGFDISEKSLRRAGLDYWQHLTVIVYPSFADYLEKFAALDPLPDRLLLSKKANQIIYEKKIKPGTHFLFGKETKGLPEDFLEKHSQEAFRIPMFDERVRSLNLAQSVAITAYEGVRQIHGFT